MCTHCNAEGIVRTTSGAPVTDASLSANMASVTMAVGISRQLSPADSRTTVRSDHPTSGQLFEAA
jgi:hypothetical protein